MGCGLSVPQRLERVTRNGSYKFFQARRALQHSAHRATHQRSAHHAA
jgi:hypothetical protein